MEHVPRERNEEVDRLSHLATAGYETLPEAIVVEWVEVEAFRPKEVMNKNASKREGSSLVPWIDGAQRGASGHVWKSHHREIPQAEDPPIRSILAINSHGCSGPRKIVETRGRGVMLSSHPAGYHHLYSSAYTLPPGRVVTESSLDNVGQNSIGQRHQHDSTERAVLVVGLLKALSLPLDSGKPGERHPSPSLPSSGPRLVGLAPRGSGWQYLLEDSSQGVHSLAHPSWCAP
ncbi:hypothetical protein LIER_42198 [Lithospermum erythrorhizon]|uniref:RNase H type-1 domain-containing protein n=1 Tax=Lithospermum erythrorhizon TaxID=34254 RepID=A0AAV3RLZ8_LITER